MKGRGKEEDKNPTLPIIFVESQFLFACKMTLGYFFWDDITMKLQGMPQKLSENYYIGLKNIIFLLSKI